jgi:hypothetical protein
LDPLRGLHTAKVVYWTLYVAYTRKVEPTKRTQPRQQSSTNPMGGAALAGVQNLAISRSLGLLLSSFFHASRFTMEASNFFINLVLQTKMKINKKVNRVHKILPFPF